MNLRQLLQRDTRAEKISFPTKYEIFSQAIRVIQSRSPRHLPLSRITVSLSRTSLHVLSTLSIHPLNHHTSDNNLHMHKTQQLRRYDNTIAYTRPDQMNRDETR